MNAITKQHNWSTFLKLFTEQNKLRPTRLGVFKSELGATADSWIENGLPFAGIDVDTHGEKAPTIEIMLGDSTKTEDRHLTHIVAGARVVKTTLSVNGETDGIEIEDAENKTTVLHFES